VDQYFKKVLTEQTKSVIVYSRTSLLCSNCVPTRV